MQNMRHLAIFAGIMLLAGIAVMVAAANPLAALFGKLAITAAIFGVAASVTSYVIHQRSVVMAALAIRNEDLHWY